MADSSKAGKPYLLGIEEVRAFLPHASPFLLVDRILEIQPKGDVTQGLAADAIGSKVVGIKNFTYNEPFFVGHFPKRPIVPGVLLIETMAQVCTFTLKPFFESMPGGVNEAAKTLQCILVGMDEVRFRKPVLPGDVLKVETVLTKKKKTIWGFDCIATVDGQVAAEASLLANLTVG